VIRPLIVTWLLVLGTTAGCRTAVGPQSAPRTVDFSRGAHASPTRAVRPLHKGHMDVSTGLYIREDDDLIVGTPLPLVLRRTYLSGDRRSRHFGVGTTHPGEWYLYGDSDPRVPWAELIRADGSRIHFTRISTGVSQADAVLQHEGATEFNGALLTWSVTHWVMRLRDGTEARFLDCEGEHQVCSLVEQSDPSGNRIAYIRDQSGRLVRMDSAGQSIAFDYDDSGRIAEAYDSSRHRVSYAYDERGRLTRATGFDGMVREFSYNDRDEMIEVREPGRIVSNQFDAAGRLARQVVTFPDSDPYIMTFAYRLDRATVVETDVGEDDGTRTVYRFNQSHGVVSEISDADGAAPIALTYQRTDSDIVTAVTLSCLGRTGPVSRTVAAASPLDDRARDELVRAECVSR